MQSHPIRNVDAIDSLKDVDVFTCVILKDMRGCLPSLPRIIIVTCSVFLWAEASRYRPAPDPRTSLFFEANSEIINHCQMVRRKLLGWGEAPHLSLGRHGHRREALRLIIREFPWGNQVIRVKRGVKKCN